MSWLCWWPRDARARRARAGTLAAIHRALAPGGLLLMQELFAPEDPSVPLAPGRALERLLYQSWGVPFARSAEALADEAGRSGFRLLRIAESPLGRLVPMHRP